jgi:hypothetical protein
METVIDRSLPASRLNDGVVDRDSHFVHNSKQPIQSFNHSKPKAVDLVIVNSTKIQEPLKPLDSLIDLSTKVSARDLIPF